MNKILSEHVIQAFHQYLIREEKSAATVEKYLRDTRAFLKYIDGVEVTKNVALSYKKHLQVKGYAVRSINSMLASINSLFAFLEWNDCKVKFIKLQKTIYCAEEKVLTKAEYFRLLEASKDRLQMNLVMQTICATGIRVSELRFFTVESVRCGEIEVNCKGKIRRILIPGKLRKLLLDYVNKQKIRTGVIFVNRRGKPLNRSHIWEQMKQLCHKADVNPKKVFPHNLRKLFARTFYGIEKDIAKLADILGHSNIETTRIYIMSSDMEHRREIERVELVMQTRLT